MLHCKYFDHKNSGDWKVRGPCRENLWKRAVRIGGKPRDNYRSCNYHGVSPQFPSPIVFMVKTFAVYLLPSSLLESPNLFWLRYNYFFIPLMYLFSFWILLWVQRHIGIAILQMTPKVHGPWLCTFLNRVKKNLRCSENLKLHCFLMILPLPY